MDNVIENISLDKLAEIENFSVRSYNLCHYNGLDSLYEILAFFNEYKNFLRIRNCGRKSNIELVNLCKKYERFDINSTFSKQEEITEISIRQQLSNLTVRHRNILNNIIDNQYRELSTRARNVLSDYSDKDISINGLFELIVGNNIAFKNLRNIGIKTEKEITLFFNNIRNFIETVKIVNNDNAIISQWFFSFLKSKFYIDSNLVNEILSDHNLNNSQPLFKTINLLLKRNFILNEKEKALFDTEINYLNVNNPSTLESIGNNIKMTKEGVRQLKNRLLNKIKSRFSFIKGFEINAINIYGLDIEEDILFIDDDLVAKINLKEDNSFNGYFITFIFSKLLYNRYEIVGDTDNLLFNITKTKGKLHNWSNLYLIKRNLIKIFDFEKFINDVSRRVSERIEADYSFHLETYLLNFLKIDDIKELKRIIPITEILLFNEFEILIDTFDNIEFKKNTLKLAYEYIYQALITLGKPSKVRVIHAKVEELYPDYQTNESKIRASLQRENIFVSYGRNSIWGLKEWKDTYKSGSMHDLAEEFLLKCKTPQHINDIVNYISRYRRNITAKNLFYNLKSAEKRRFVFFDNSYIGMVNRDYSKEFIKSNEGLIKKRTWEENFSILENFINSNNRLPYSNINDEEAKLYRFLNIQLRKSKDGIISEQKIEMLNNLIFPYVTTSRKTQNRQSDSVVANNRSQSLSLNKKQRRVTSTWWNSLQKLKEYLSENGQYPTATDDRSLYSFCYICNKKLEDGSLHELQIEALEEMDFTFNSENKKTWDDWFQELSLFWKENNYWPKSTNNTDENEMRLYRFCNAIFKDFKNEDLNQNQIQKLQGINYPIEQGSLSNIWLENYQKLICFRKLNPNSWPQARGIELEKPLYQFCYRNKNKFKNGTLEPYKIQLLNEINFDFYG